MPDGKPNIVVIWGDNIGISNLSCYSDGLMGYRTPNMDRVANEGMRFTDHMASRAAPPVAVVPDRPERVQDRHEQSRDARHRRRPEAEDPTIAELLKPLGYATGQFGKNHLGD